MISGLWHKPVRINRNFFRYKSLSSWSCNIAVGCEHACRFCYVPSASTNKLAEPLKFRGVDDPDAQWGDYVFVRPWDQKAFMASLRVAEKIPMNLLNADGNRAVMFCSTTDPFQALEGEHRAELQRNLTRALAYILEDSTLNVRILTRSPLARTFFPLMKTFGSRLLFGMSLPTLNNQLARVYEPKAPAPSQRLATLRAAKEAGLNVYVAVAPTYPECDDADMDATFKAIKELDPVTVFHEPINIRAENVARIETHANELGFTLSRKAVFDSPTTWRRYALHQLMTAEELGAFYRLPIHLWPDSSLGSKVAIAEAEDGGHRTNHRAWLESWWSRVSAWPQAEAAKMAEEAACDVIP
jgi:DNA repair photolyase